MSEGYLSTLNYACIVYCLLTVFAIRAPSNITEIKVRIKTLQREYFDILKSSSYIEGMAKVKYEASVTNGKFNQLDRTYGGTMEMSLENPAPGGSGVH